MTPDDDDIMYEFPAGAFLHATFRPWRYDRGRPIRPPPDPNGPDYRDPYWKARYEHAWLLRCEGLTYRTIGARLGLSHERARQMVMKFSRIMNSKIRRHHMCLRFVKDDAA
jgi:hypothetical protein